MGGANGDQMGIQYTYFPLYFKGLTAKRNVWLKRPYQGKSIALPLHAVEALVNTNARYSETS